MRDEAMKSLGKSVHWAACWLLAWTVALCWLAPSAYAEEKVTEAVGTMQKVGDFGFGIVPDDDPGTRYAPTEEVMEAFQKDGLRVIFSGTVQGAEDGRSGRRWGTPIALTQLEALPDSQENEDEAADDASDPRSSAER